MIISSHIHLFDENSWIFTSSPHLSIELCQNCTPFYQLVIFTWDPLKHLEINRTIYSLLSLQICPPWNLCHLQNALLSTHPAALILLIPSHTMSQSSLILVGSTSKISNSVPSQISTATVWFQSIPSPTWTTHSSSNHPLPSNSVLHRGICLNQNQVRSVNCFQTFRKLLLYHAPYCSLQVLQGSALPSPPALSSLSPALVSKL